MPVIINPKNMGEYNEEREKRETRHPEFTMAKWGKGRIKEGEKVELEAQVKDIDEKNMITFQVWREGQDPAVHVAERRIPTSIEGGSAKGEWEYHAVDLEGGPPPEEDPVFFFTVHSAWCQYKESGRVVVELWRPELSNPEWLDPEGNGTGKGLVGEVMKLSVSCNDEMEEGAGVTFRVYADGMDPKRDTPIEEIASKNLGGKAEAEWTYRYKHDPENPLTEKPKYFFTANGQRCKEVRSGNVEMGQGLSVEFLDDTGQPLDNKFEYELKHHSGESIKGNTSEKIEKTDLIPGKWDIILTAKGKEA
jgi:hypothetical protein